MRRSWFGAQSAAWPAAPANAEQMTAAMRLVLASSALLIITIDPTEPDRYVAATYASLILYSLYSSVLYAFAHLSICSLSEIRGWAHWLDVGWYTVLIALSSGTNSIFFFGFLFAILTAAFRFGLRSGLMVTVASGACFTGIGLLTSTITQDGQINRFLLRPVYLVVLGYMMARWGEFQLLMNRRLAFLKEIGSVSNPRFGVDHTIATILDRLRSFYGADSCLMVTEDPESPEYRLRRVERENMEAGLHAEAISPDLAARLLILPDDRGMVYRSDEKRRWIGRAYRTGGETLPTAGDRSAAEMLATLLDVESFLTVPLLDRNRMAGRMYVTGSNGAFVESDVDFLMQVNKQVIPVVQNIRLVDRLASTAAEEERRRIARDIHDSFIQPYSGLEMGLVALRHRLRKGDGDIQGGLERLIELVRVAVIDMRRYTTSLKDPTGEPQGYVVEALRRIASRFSEVSGLHVDVECLETVRVNDRLAAETFQIVAEGLSNVRRHTQAPRALVRLQCVGDHVELRIENEWVDGLPPAPFVPRSISERAAALGGRARIEMNGRTAVDVEIPL